LNWDAPHAYWARLRADAPVASGLLSPGVLAIMVVSGTSSI
jgi:hypothetical protein